MLEQHVFYLWLAGLALVLVGYVWLMIRAFKVRFLWGLSFLLLPVLLAGALIVLPGTRSISAGLRGPLAPALAGAVLLLPLLFLILHRRRVILPLLVFMLGIGTFFVPYGVAYYYRHYVPLGPRDKMVDGERHLTLTGWDMDDYSLLWSRQDTVVLQMANEDVTDATLTYLWPMEDLRELDLNDTAVTDDGLKLLAGLPKLEILRLRDTAITDEGFRTHLLPLERLKFLDLRRTKVSSASKDEWRKRKPDERKMFR